MSTCLSPHARAEARAKTWRDSDCKKCRRRTPRPQKPHAYVIRMFLLMQSWPGRRGFSNPHSTSGITNVVKGSNPACVDNRTRARRSRGQDFFDELIDFLDESFYTPCLNSSTRDHLRQYSPTVLVRSYRSLGIPWLLSAKQRHVQSSAGS